MHTYGARVWLEYPKIADAYPFTFVLTVRHHCTTLLVAGGGETETWVINELARQCGHHFDAEGIKVIEFAQSGLKPLVKFARR
ncbi:hypothetical protein ACLB1M_09105 [Escherichia coli]